MFWEKNFMVNWIIYWSIMIHDKETQFLFMKWAALISRSLKIDICEEIEALDLCNSALVWTHYEMFVSSRVQILLSYRNELYMDNFVSTAWLQRQYLLFW